MSRFDQVISRKNTSSIRWDKYGEGIIPLWVADMDFAVPDCVTHTLEKRIRHPIYGYTHVAQECKEAIQQYLLERYDYAIEPEWLVFLPSVVTGLHMAARHLLQEGEHALIPDPAYHHFQMALEGANRSFSHYPYILQENRWVIDLAAIKELIQPNTRLLMLCNPHNPGGTVLREEEIVALTCLAKEHGLIICSDEIHADLILDADKQHYPIGKEVSYNAWIMSLMSLNKTFNFPGIGMGWAVIANPELRARFAKDLHTLIPGPNALAYEVSLAAMQGGKEWQAELIAYLRINRDLITQWVTRQPGLSMAHLDATYLAWIDAQPWQHKNLVSDFLAAGVAVSPGQQFGKKNFFRLNFGTQRALLEEALEKMASVLHVYR